MTFLRTGIRNLLLVLWLSFCWLACTMWPEDSPQRETRAEASTLPSLRTGSPALPENSPSASRPPGLDDSAYRLKPLDPVVIYLRGIPNPDEINEIVDEWGNINLPYIGSIKADGHTTSELEKKIEETYLSRQIYKQVTVNVVIPAQSYYVRGEVRKPGRYPLISGVTLVQAIAAAGGYTEFANPRKTKVIRGGKTFVRDIRELEQRPEKDEDIESGDVIVIPRSVF